MSSFIRPIRVCNCKVLRAYDGCTKTLNFTVWLSQTDEPVLIYFVEIVLRHVSCVSTVCYSLLKIKKKLPHVMMMEDDMIIYKD